MRAAIYREFGGPITVEPLADPTPAVDGVVIEVRASGICRSDLRGWEGHDPDIVLPHVPGHELSGVIVAAGRDVTRSTVGDRVTVPFCGGCGSCGMCRSGQTQICDHATQPGFTTWGSFAEFVAIEHADVNIVKLPDEVDFPAAALLGCRFITAYRAVVERARLGPGEWLSVHGCGGVGLSAVMIGASLGARVVAVDIDPRALDAARRAGAEATLDASAENPVEAIHALTDGGAHVSVDALGAEITAGDAIRGLRKLGRHVQPGLFHGATAAIPMNDVIGRELTVLGTHGMAGHRIPDLLHLVIDGRLRPELLLERTLTLDEFPTALVAMQTHSAPGVAVVTSFN